MKKTFAVFPLLTLVAAVILVKPEGISAQPKRSDLEERVATLEVDATISRRHIQDLESHVSRLESNAEESVRDRSASDLEASVSWIRHVYIPTSIADIDRLDKRVTTLERDHLLEDVCARPTAKQKADSVQVALAKQRAALCLELGGKRN